MPGRVSDPHFAWWLLLVQAVSVPVGAAAVWITTEATPRNSGWGQTLGGTLAIFGTWTLLACSGALGLLWLLARQHVQARSVLALIGPAGWIAVNVIVCAVLLFGARR